MSDQGIFLDILARLNLASVERVLKDVNTAMREGGKSSSRSFSEGFSLNGAKAQFGELAKASETAYRDMERGLHNLQIQESRINEMRANSYRHTSQAMIAAQREFDAALVNSQKLIEASTAADAERRASVAAAGRGRTEPSDRRGVPPIISRGANIAGPGAALGAAGFIGEGVKFAAQEQANLNQILTRHQDTLQNIQIIQQGIHQVVRETGFSPDQVTSAAEAAEQAGYRGKDVLAVVETAAKTARVAGAELHTTLAGLTTTMQDFGVKALAGDPAKATEFLSSMNDMAGKFIVTIANLKDINPAEYFKSLSNIEPIAAEYMSGVPKIQATTQIDSIAAMMSQIGMPPQRGMLNLAQAISKMGNAKGVTATALEQLGLKPEGIAVEMRDQGITPVLHTLQEAIGKKYNPQTGMYNMGWKFNDAGQLKELQQMDLDQLGGMGEQGEAALQILKGQKFQAGTATNMDIKKAFGAAGITDPTITGAVRNWLAFQKKANGPSKGIQGGMMPELTEAQVISQIAGTGDVQRTMLGALQNLPMLDNLQEQYLSQGTSAGFTDAFKNWTQALDPQIKILGGQLKDLAEAVGEKMLPTVTHWVTDINGFLDKYKWAGDALVDAMMGVGAVWLASKAKIPQLLGGAAGLLEKGAYKFGGINPNVVTGGPPVAAGGGTELASGVVSGAKEGAPVLGGGVLTGAKEGAAVLSGGVAAGAKESAGALTAGVAEGGKGAGAQIAEAMVGAGKEAGVEMAGAITEAGAGISGGLRGAINPLLIATLGAGAVDSTIGKIEKAHPGTKPWLDILRNTPTGVGAWHWGKKGYDWLTGGKAHGGIVGYKGGTGAVDPYSQPLLGQPDMKRDSILGMLPGGMPVGLRGGEGILTPEAVHAIGGKDAIDGLNNNPWSNPLKVATTFYGSFADGVAKYSPWGKYLKASSQTLDSLTQEFDQSTKAHEAGGGMSRGQEGGMLQAMIAQMTPEQRASMGITTGPRGGLMLPGGQRVSSLGHAAEGVSGGKGTAQYIYQAALAKGYSPSDATAIVAYAIGESGLNPKISGGRQGDDEVIGLFQEKSGFARSGGVDPSQRGTMEGNVTAYLNNLEGHRGQGDIYNQLLRTSVGGPMYTGGRGYMNQLYSQAQAVLGGDSGNKWWGKSRGGVVGFADGGVTPGSPGPGGGGNNRDSPGATMHPNIPDWWHGGSNYGDLDPWWISAQWGDRGPDIGWGTGPGGHYGSGGSPGLPMYPSHSPGKNGIGGFSTGGIVGFDPGGVVPPPSPIPGPVPFPGMPRTNDDIAPPDQGSAGTPSGAARLGTGASSKPTVPKDDRLAQTKPVETPPGNSPPGSLVPQGTQPGMAPTPSGDRNINQNPSHNVAEGNTGKGFGLGGGLVGSLEGAAQSAISAAGLAADASGADGGGSAGAAAANQALQIGFQLANRAIGYGGQLAGIGLEGLSETFLPHDSEKSVPTKNLFGKIALGIAGAHPSGSNVAGDSVQQLKPKDGLDAGASQTQQGGGPMVHMENTTINHNGPGDVHNEMQRGINAALFGAGQLGG